MVHNTGNNEKTYKQSINLFAKLLGENTYKNDKDESEDIRKLIKIFDDQREKINDIIVDSETQQEKYRENLFSKEDFLFYRGIAYFYLKNYKAAIINFEESELTKKSSENQFNNDSKANKSENSRDSIDTDLSDIGLCAVNVNEYHYNIVLCLILVLSTINLEK